MTYEAVAKQGAWDAGALALVAELNEQLLELLQAAADTQAGAGLRLIRALRAEWVELSASARQRLALCPYLLIDAGFTQPERWQSTVGVRVMDASAGHGYFTLHTGPPLLRRTLLLAWHLARCNRLVARIALGMSTACVECVAQYRLRDLEWLAELAPPWIRPRWENQPRIWRELIAAARGDNAVLLRQLQLRGVTLLAATVPTGQRDGLLC
jgi:hypothetical protein